MKVEFFKHNISQEDIDELSKVLKSIFLTTGEWTKKFEEKLAAYVRAPYAVGLTSCTSALELSLKHFGIGEGDEVITTPMSFVATANAIEMCYAKPVFVDCEAETGNINAALIERAITPKTKAILPVHLFGQMCDMKRIKEIAKKHNLKIIEDSAHCLEGERDGIRAGQLADISCYSFYATKNITSGEGGAISTQDKNIYEWFVKARSHGLDTDAADRYTKLYRHYDMAFLGFKCNMSNIEAALLLHQIDRIEGYLKLRKQIADSFFKAFEKNQYIKYPIVLPGTKHAYHLFTIWVDPKKRDEYLHQLQQRGVGVAVNYRSIHLMSYYQNKYRFKRGDFPVCERIGDSTISIPLYPKLTQQECDFVIKTVNEVINA